MKDKWWPFVNSCSAFILSNKPYLYQIKQIYQCGYTFISSVFIIRFLWVPPLTGMYYLDSNYNYEIQARKKTHTAQEVTLLLDRGGYWKKPSDQIPQTAHGQ